MSPRLIVAVLIIFAAVFAGFGASYLNEFVDWDDDHLLMNNTRFRGLGAENLRWMFTTTMGGHYQPLTWLSYALEYRLLGRLNAPLVHVTNLVLHACTAVGVFFVSSRLFRAATVQDAIGPGNAMREKSTTAAGTNVRTAGPSLVGPLVAALGWSVHPLRVESVVWATERRDVLCGFWLVLATLCYLHAVEPGRVGRGRWLAYSAAIYALSLLSKTAGMTWPLVLLFLDFYPLKRANWSGVPSAIPLRRVVLQEKLPFFGLAFAAGAVAWLAQRRAGAMWPLELHPLGLRIAQAFYGIVFYLWKTLIPTGLLPLYEQQPDARPWGAEFVVSGLIALVVSVAVWVMRRRCPGLLVGWLSYLVILSPMLGLAQSGPQLVADRYSYLAGIPLCVLVGAGVQTVWKRSKLDAWRRRFLAGLCTAGILALTFATRAQTTVWRDTRTLWTHVLSHAPRTGLAHANIAALMMGEGDFPSAVEHAFMALDILPRNTLAQRTLGRSAAMLGNFELAERHLRAVIALDAARPDDWVQLGYVLSRMGRLGEAEECYGHAVALDPRQAAWHFEYAGFLVSHGRLQEAAEQYAEAVGLDPHLAEAHFRLGVIHEREGRLKKALDAYEQASNLDPVEPKFLTKLAWFLSTCSDAEFLDGPQSLKSATTAVRLTNGQDPRAREVLAAALARTGDFAGARLEVEKLLREENGRLDDAIRQRLHKAVASYAREQPYCAGEESIPDRR